MPSDSQFLARLVWFILTVAVLVLLFRNVPDVIEWFYYSSSGSQENAATRIIEPRGNLAEDEKSTIKLFEQSRDSVVFITTRQTIVDVWTRDILSVPSGTGSGFIWDDNGHIITNFHVVKDASEATTVRLTDKRDYKATLVGASPAHDIAVLKIDIGFIKRPTPVPLGTSQDLQVGQKVFAIGNPFGLDWTLTTGIVSALDRSVPTAYGRNIENLIQTDAAINPGNSGGPLLDSAGRLIGINTVIYSPTGASAGIGFAVPVDTVNRVVPQLISRGKYIRPGLGITVDSKLNDRLTKIMDITGVVILNVSPGSAAAVARLKGVKISRDGSVTPGDIIVALDDRPIVSVEELLSRLDKYRVGDTVQVTILRNNNEITVPIILQAGV
jgi:S1-C subfamily serine protease